MTQTVAATARPRSVAVVIPAKDEAERIERTVLTAFEIDRVDLVVVVDDGSTDATSALAKGAGAVVVRHKVNRGKASAMATGAKVVHMREEAATAALLAPTMLPDVPEEQSRGTMRSSTMADETAPETVPEDSQVVPRVLLFIDADMQESAIEAEPLVRAVLDEGVDMAIATLPPQDGAAGMGLVVKTARNGIRKATGFEAEQPLSGTRCVTRETWDAVQPLAHGWGVETGLTIDALHAGFWVKEVPANLRHRATGKDFRGQIHRASQLKDVVRALVARRKMSPNDPLYEEPTEEDPAASTEQ